MTVSISDSLAVLAFLAVGWQLKSIA